MIKKGVMFLFAVVLLFSFSSVLAYDYNVSNLSLQKEYAPSSFLSGTFFLNLTNAPVDLYFDSDFGTMTLRNFLKANNKGLGCESINCSDLLTVAGTGLSEKTISLSSGSEETFGLLIEDPQVLVTSLSFDFDSDFSESTENPLQVKVANSQEILYDQFTDSFTRHTSYGCFDTSLSSYNSVNLRDNDTTTYEYCQKVNLKESNKYLLGAEISGSNVLDLEFSLIDKLGSLELGTCEVSINNGQSRSYSDDVSCIIETTEMNSKGDYFVCVKDVTVGTGVEQYKLKSENQGQKCGYPGRTKISSASTRDYAIYAKQPTYEAASPSTISATAISQINQYLSQVYSSNCLNGCIIPISFSGVNQNLEISNVQLTYQSAGSVTNNLIYDIDSEVRKTNFSGTLDISKFEWEVSSSPGEDDFKLYLKGDGTEELFDEEIDVSASIPVIYSVSPQNPAAGVNVPFYAKVTNRENSQIEWDFGDGTVETTTENYIVHRYKNISNYNLTISVGSGSNNTKKTFLISTISPKDSLNLTLDAKRINLNNAKNDIEALPSWYRSFVNGLSKVDFYKGELDRLQIDYANAITDQDYLNFATGLYELIVPNSIFKSEETSGPWIYDSNKIDPSVIQEIYPSSLEERTVVSDYKQQIFSWQLENIESTYTKKKYELLRENGELLDLILVYDFSFKNNFNEDVYIIIQKDLANLNFESSNNGFVKKGSNSYYLLSSGEEKEFSFFVNGSAETPVYVSPALSSIVFNDDIGVCNFNQICEKGLGETYKNCGVDCPPRTPATWWLVIFLILALIVYTILQIWYKRKYEEYLFRDKKNMFNLVMFINNAKMNKMSDREIKESLISKGWEPEQVDYTILRAKGRNLGMFEIVPIDKLTAYYNKKMTERKTEGKKVAPPQNPRPIQRGMQRRPFNPTKPKERYQQKQGFGNNSNQGFRPGRV